MSPRRRKLFLHRSEAARTTTSSAIVVRCQIHLPIVQADLKVQSTKENQFYFMCLQATPVKPYQKWHWAGDEIISSIIPASRKVPGTGRKYYPIDIREFLSIKGNAVVHKELHALIDKLPVADRARFASEKPGNFDFRADKVIQHVGRLKYIPIGRDFDHWLFPDETLANDGGDCEDLAFLIAALLDAAGISSYCVRVALGRVDIHGGPKPRSFDHAWVMYNNEGGAWEILEPMALIPAATRAATPATFSSQKQTVEYVPYFVFNSEHLWNIRSKKGRKGPLTDYLATRRFWTKFEPTFAAGVHKSIFDDALNDLISPADLRVVKRASFWVDVNVLNYDPRDHFDFGYIDESWQRVQQRLHTGKLKDFGLAGHAIADFYGHSLYGEFAEVPEGELELYVPGKTELAREPAYDFKGCDLPGCELNRKLAAKHWKGQIISGQWWRWYATFPDDLQGTADFKKYRRCLPDHDVLAVDSAAFPGRTHRYSADEFQQQFALRQTAAIKHIRQAYQDWHGGKTQAPSALNHVSDS